MKFKMSLTVFCLLFNFVFLQASSNFSSSDDGSEGSTNSQVLVGIKKSLTKEQVRMSRERQAAAIADQVPVVEIGTGDVLCSELSQLFIYHHQEYKKIGLGIFYEKYRDDIVETLKQAAQAESRLPFHIEDLIHSSLKKNMKLSNLNKEPVSRKMAIQAKQGGQYRILGAEVPSTFIVEEEEFKDAIFNITQAKKVMLESVKQYVDDNLQEVHATCVPSAPFQSTSNKVLRIPCCGAMFHKRCLVSCKKYKVSSCLNSQCKVAENGACFSAKWDEEFYSRALESHAVTRKEIPAKDECLVCTSPLKRNVVQAALVLGRSTTKKVRPMAGCLCLGYVKWK